MPKHSPFHLKHLELNARMVDFAGWIMPLHYGSQIKEHESVRQSVGIFDVSHMGIIDLKGTIEFLKYLLPTNIDRIAPNKAFYTCLLREDGGIVDDIIVYQLAPDHYRLIVNAATRSKDLHWLIQQAKGFEIQIFDLANQAIIAIQGPQSLGLLIDLLPNFPIKALRPFEYHYEEDILISRTGYTGELGFELIGSADRLIEFWEQCLKLGVCPCGLAARDSLRLEAGFNLYGADIDETVTPFESNLSWVVDFNPPERLFIGRQALANQSSAKRLVGLALDKAIPRAHQLVYAQDKIIGQVTSGSFSPTLKQGIALARIIPHHDCSVDIRGKRIPAQVVKPVFVRNGQSVLSLFNFS